MAGAVVCPACRYPNIEGDDTCANCGASLWPSDVPEQATSFQGRLLGEHLDALGVGTPLAVERDAPVADVIGRMHDGEIDCALVTDDGRLVGIFTDRDAVLKLDGNDLATVRVGDVMTPDPVVLRPTDTLAVAINKMAVGGFRHIPLVDRGRPLGVVGARDVFRHIVAILG